MFRYRVMVDYGRKEFEARELISYVREQIEDEGFFILNNVPEPYESYPLLLESSLVERMNGDFFAKFEFSPIDDGEEIDLELITDSIFQELTEIADSRVRVDNIVVDIV